MKIQALLIFKDTISSLCDLNYQEMNKGSSNLLDLRIKSILAFKICILTSSEYFELSNRSVLGTVVSA